jgi:hypothetical protein
LICNVFVWCVARSAGEILVNLEVVAIFNGILETQKSAKSRKRFAKFGLNHTRQFAVNHGGINHAAPPTRFYRPLGDARVLGRLPEEAMAGGTPCQAIASGAPGKTAERCIRRIAASFASFFARLGAALEAR